MNVTDRIALVTGGARGLGRGIVLALAQNGADLAVADLNTPKEVVAEAESLGRRSFATAVDVTDQASVDRMVHDVTEHFGRIDILVNNAGILAAPGMEDRERYSEQDWDMVYAVNVKGMARVTDAVSPHMKERQYGKVVNISSTGGRRPDLPEYMPYCASKAGVISLTQAASQELAPFSVNVNAICPGLIWTPMWERIGKRMVISSQNTEGLSPREHFDLAVKDTTPLGREQTPEDIGNLAAFLASDAARNITGQSINVDGGAFTS